MISEGKRSEGGKEQCDKVLATGGELTKGERIYEQGEKWTEREQKTQTERNKAPRPRVMLAVL